MKYGEIKKSNKHNESENHKIFIKIIILTSSLFFSPQLVKAESFHTQMAEKDLSIINRTLESLEAKLRKSDYMEACIEASRAAKLIKHGLQGLKAIEPNYNWLEIREVLLEIPIKNCPKAIQKKKEY